MIYTNNWFEIRGEKTWPEIFKDKEVKSVLEIGSYEGQSTVWMLENFPKAVVTAVDIFDANKAEDWDGYTEVDKTQETTYEQRFDKNVKKYGKRVLKVKDRSIKFLAAAIDKGARYDFIYVDGDHRKLPATQDMAMAIELLSDKGIMIVDDYRGIPWLFDAVNAFCDTLDSEVFEWSDTSDGEQKIIRRK